MLEALPLVDMAQGQVVESPARQALEVEQEGALTLGNDTTHPIDRPVEESDAADVGVFCRRKRALPPVRRLVAALLIGARDYIDREAVQIEGGHDLGCRRRDEGSGPG